MSSYEKINEEIQNVITKAGESGEISSVHAIIWPSVVKLEVFFRKTGDIRALEDQIFILFQMQDNIFRASYLKDAYVICKRILDLRPDDEAAKHSITDHIIPYFKTDWSFMKNDIKTDEDKKEYDELMESQNNIESDLDSYFLECKKDEFALFLDDGANNFNSQGNNVGEK